MPLRAPFVIDISEQTFRQEFILWSSPQGKGEFREEKGKETVKGKKNYKMEDKRDAVGKKGIFFLLKFLESFWDWEGFSSAFKHYKYYS